MKVSEPIALLVALGLMPLLQLAWAIRRRAMQWRSATAPPAEKARG